MKKCYCENQEKLARITKALGHPARLAILCYLAEHDDCFFGDIFESLPIAKATVSQHIAELKDAGLIKSEEFPPKVKYCIDKENLLLAKKLMDCFWSKCEKGCE